MEFIKKYKKIIASILLAIGVILAIFVYYLEEDEEESFAYADIQATNITTTMASISEPASFYVDIKGEVKKPGVYQVNADNIVQDVITLAGGLKSGASTNNINLSEKVKEAMVIYVFSQKELKAANQANLSTATCTTNVIEVNKCDTITTTNSNSSETNQNTLVNINTASKEELMTVPNIGSSKADSIIIYRAENKFNSIEDIMNVSGIGESVFVKIKDYITV